MATILEKAATPQPFAIIFVIGAPGAGKGTLCTYLADNHNLVHYSIGDNLRTWVRENCTTPLAIRIQDNLDNQGFLSPEDLNPFLSQAIENIINRGGPKSAGILFDGYPRCVEQVGSFETWPWPGVSRSGTKPDAVLYFEVSKENARTRYMARARDSNDSEEKFEKRFAEFEVETLPVVKVYAQRGILISIDANGTKEENVGRLEKGLEQSRTWQAAVNGEKIGNDTQA